MTSLWDAQQKLCSKTSPPSADICGVADRQPHVELAGAHIRRREIVLERDQIEFTKSKQEMLPGIARAERTTSAYQCHDSWKRLSDAIIAPAVGFDY